MTTEHFAYENIDHRQSIELLKMHKSHEIQRSAAIDELIERFESQSLTGKQRADLDQFKSVMQQMELWINAKSHQILGAQPSLN